MSVDRTDFIVYGWKLPYKLKNENGEIDLWADKFLPFIEGHKGVEYTLISDGMSGEYNVFGKLIAHATDDGNGWGFKNLDFTATNSEEVKSKYKELFEIDTSPSEPYLFIFSHFH